MSLEIKIYYIMGNKVLTLATCERENVCERVSDLLRGLNVSSKIEVMFLYICRGDKLPIELSDAEEAELLDVMRCIKDTKKAVEVLKSYLSNCKERSSRARFVLCEMIRSYELSREISGLFKELVEGEDSCVYTPVPFTDEDGVFGDGEYFDSTSERLEKLKDKNEAIDEDSEDFD